MAGRTRVGWQERLTPEGQDIPPPSTAGAPQQRPKKKQHPKNGCCRIKQSDQNVVVVVFEQVLVLPATQTLCVNVPVTLPIVSV
jgi:hypothetical protein